MLRSLKEKRGIVTGNLTTPYIFNFLSLEEGRWRSSIRPERPPVASWTSGSARWPTSV